MYHNDNVFRYSTAIKVEIKRIRSHELWLVLWKRNHLRSAEYSCWSADRLAVEWLARTLSGLSQFRYKQTPFWWIWPSWSNPNSPTILKRSEDWFEMKTKQSFSECQFMILEYGSICMISFFRQEFHIENNENCKTFFLLHWKVLKTHWGDDSNIPSSHASQLQNWLPFQLRDVH